MDPLSIAQIAAFAGGNLGQGRGETLLARICTDTRTLRPGDLFLALRGDTFDGHRFVQSAANSGAVGAIVASNFSEQIRPPFALIRVTDTLTAYQQIAAHYRSALPLKVIAITGSNGKTSTKDFVAAVLGRRFQVTKTAGNFNNHVGLPKTILEASAADEFAVWEIGMNHPGEIAPLAKIAAPDVAIITNIGKAHIEFMGSKDAIAREKGALAEALPAEGILILNSDDPFSGAIAQRTSAKVIYAGLGGGWIRAAEIRQSVHGSEFTLLEGAHHCRARLPIPSLHMVQNALFAVAVGRTFGVSLEDCADALASAPLAGARLQVKTVRDIQFLDDSYNANPDSMIAALRTLAEMPAPGRRIAILGHMGELGGEAERGHREVGEAAAACGLDQLIVVGPAAVEIERAALSAGLAQATFVESVEEAAARLREVGQPGDLVLIKGSRSARMEQVLEKFAAALPAPIAV